MPPALLCLWLPERTADPQKVHLPVPSCLVLFQLTDWHRRKSRADALATAAPMRKGKVEGSQSLGWRWEKKKNLLKFKIHSALEEGPQCCWKAECSWLTAVSDFFINPNKMCLFSTCTFMQINWLHNLPNVACIHSGEVYILSQTTFYKYSRFLQNST